MLTGNYIDIDEAAVRLSEHNPLINKDKLQKYAEPNSKGDRKLPFIKCEMTGRLIIDEGVLPFILSWYQEKQEDALKGSIIYGVYCKEKQGKGNRLPSQVRKPGTLHHIRQA